MITAILLTALALSLIHQSFLKYHWKKFGFTMTWASLIWISGMVTRSISVYNPQNVNLFIAQYVLILIGPPLFAAAEYFVLGRLLAYLPYHAPIHPGRVFSTFAMLSVLVESLTATGAANSSGSGRDPKSREAGFRCLQVALILQCFVEVLFFSIVALVERRCRRAKIFPRNVRVVVYVLYTTSLMILVRCIIRTIEGFEASGCNPETDDGLHYCGVISTHEVFLWVFEIANIVLVVVLLAVFFPGKYLPRSSKIYLAMDGKTERSGPGFSKADKRPLWLTIIDPFNLYQILTGRGMKIDEFWKEEHPAYNGDTKTSEANPENT